MGTSPFGYFLPIGVRPPWFEEYGLLQRNKAGIKNYYVAGEILFSTIGPARYGTTQELLPTQKWTIITIDFWFIKGKYKIPDLIGNHGMDAVIEALE